jgi:hypothetical protein
MNAVYFNTRGGPEALVYGAATMPGAGKGEIVVALLAFAVFLTSFSAAMSFLHEPVGYSAAR